MQYFNFMRLENVDAESNDAQTLSSCFQVLTEAFLQLRMIVMFESYLYFILLFLNNNSSHF